MAASNRKPKPRGRPFEKGCKPGPGRPPRAAEENYLAAIKSAVTTADMAEIAAKAREQAKRGDRYAREWLSKQFGTEAAQKIEQEVRQTNLNVEAPIAVDGDAELERLVREASARLYGPRPDPAPAPVEAPTQNGANGDGAHPHA